MKGAKPRILLIALETAQNAGQQGGPRQHIGIWSEGSMCRHCIDQNADLLNDALGARVSRIEHADRVHQLLNGHGRVVGCSKIQEFANGIGSPALQAIDIDAGVQQQPVAGARMIADKRQVGIIPPR